MSIKVVMLLIRHLLTAVGAVGVISDSEIETLAGALMIVVGLVWSWLEKRRAQQEAAAIAYAREIDDR